MKKYFGTDGIRGVANEFLTPELAFKLARVLGKRISSNTGKRPYVYVGKDSRLSSPLLEYSLISGFLASGIDVKRLHLTPTPGVAYLTKSTEASMGIMVSASHNPYFDNGIKIFGESGFKLRDDEELEIESEIDNGEIERSTYENVGEVLNRHESIYQYIESLFFSVNSRFDGLKIGLDCANGSTSVIAKRLFTRLGADVLVINDHPNGKNINDNCGATEIGQITKLVIDNKLDVGFAFDGDGDRVICVDNMGNPVDGDHMLMILSKQMAKNNKLNNGRVATTVMSNMGLFNSLEAESVEVNVTDVGDRYVLANMIDNGLNLGGEQSGHIIMLDYNTCGDGMLVALKLTEIMVKNELKMSELSSGLTKYPQLLGKITVSNKTEIMENTSLLARIKDANKTLGRDGRVLIRPSGTEPVIRVMVEAVDIKLCKQYYKEMFGLVEKLA